MYLSPPSNRDSKWYDDKKGIEDNLENNMDTVNMSMIIESAVESGFQVIIYSNQF